MVAFMGAKRNTNTVAPSTRGGKTIIPEKFAVEFDGWTSSDVHYVALFASYTKDKGHKETLLALAPLLDEEHLGAVQHIDFIKATLELYQKTLTNVVAFIGDNCATNRHF